MAAYAVKCLLLVRLVAVADKGIPLLSSLGLGVALSY